MSNKVHPIRPYKPSNHKAYTKEKVQPSSNHTNETSTRNLSDTNNNETHQKYLSRPSICRYLQMVIIDTNDYVHKKKKKKECKTNDGKEFVKKKMKNEKRKRKEHNAVSRPSLPVNHISCKCCNHTQLMQFISPMMS